MSGLIGKIKSQAQKQGTNKEKIFFVRDGEKKRVRFLQELDDGLEVIIHSSFDKGISVLCQAQLGKNCKYCDDETLKEKTNYVWSVWDYDANQVRLFMYQVNRCSPIPALLALNETYGTIMDRDYVISVTGKQINKSFSVIPMDKVKFRNEKAKPIAEATVWKILAKAFPVDDGAIEDDSETTEGAWEEEEKKSKYSGMKPVELFKLCASRHIASEPKKPAAYYINLLEEADSAEDDWGDEEAEEEEDDWVEEE